MGLGPGEKSEGWERGRAGLTPDFALLLASAPPLSPPQLSRCLGLALEEGTVGMGVERGLKEERDQLLGRQSKGQQPPALTPGLARPEPRLRRAHQSPHPVPPPSAGRGMPRAGPQAEGDMGPLLFLLLLQNSGKVVRWAGVLEE